MHTATATVVSVLPNRATVDVEPAAVCARCAAGKGCGAGLLGSSRKTARLEVDVSGELALEPGQKVRLALHPSGLLRASMMAYGMPLAGFVAGAALAWILGSNVSEWPAIVSAITGLLLGAAIGRRRLRSEDCLQNFVPVIDRRLGDDADTAAAQ